MSPRQFGKLINALRREGADPVRKGRPWSLPLEDRVFLVAGYWRTNQTFAADCAAVRGVEVGRRSDHIFSAEEAESIVAAPSVDRPTCFIRCGAQHRRGVKHHRSNPRRSWCLPKW
jgi:hypothetical protein